MSAGSRQLKINIIGDAKSAEEAFASVEKSAGGMSEKLGTVGKVAGAAFVGIGAAAAGAFVVGAKGALDQEQALDKLQAQLGLTADEADEMGEVARNVFEGAWGDSVPGVLESIQTIRTALGDMSSEELQGLTEKFLTIEDLWAAPVEETARTVSTLTKNFKDLSEEQALDLITTGFQKGGDVGGELLDTLNEYAPAFSNIGLSADQFLGTLIAGSEAGAFSVDKVGDAMKEFEIRGQDASAATNEAFESMGLNAEEMGQAIASGGEAGERAFQASLAALAAMEDPVARNAAGVALFGSQWEDVGEDVVLAMAEGIEGIEGFEGATERAGDAAYDNLGTMWESFKRQAMGALTEAVTPAVLALAEGIGRIGKAFQEGGISGALEEVKEIGGEIWDSIAGLDWNGIAGTVIDGLTTGLSAAGDMTASIATWLWDAFKGINWQGIGETMVDGLMSGVSAVIDVGSRILTWLSDQLTSVDWSGLGMTVVDGLMAGIMAVIDAGERVLGWLSGQLSAVDWSGLGTTIVDGLMAGVTAVQDFGQRFVDWFRGGAESADWSGIGETISGQLSGALDTITDLGPVQSLIDMFNTHLLPVLQTVGDEIGNRVKPTIDGFRDSLGRVAENISTNLGPTLTNLRELWVQLQPAIGALLPILQTIATVVAGVLLAAFNGFVGLMSGVLPNAVNAAFAVLNGLIGIITGLVQTVTGVVQVIKGIFTGDWALAWKGAQNVVEGMVGAITSLFSGLWGALKGFIMAVVDGVIGLFQGLYNTVVGNSIIPDMINGIIEWFLKLPGEVIGIIGGWVGSVQGFFSDLQSTLTQVVSDTISAILEFFGNLITDGVTKAGEFVTGVIDKLIELFIDGPKRIYDFVVAGVEEIAKLAVRGAEEAGKLPGAVLEAIGDLSGTLLDAGSDIVQGLIDGITSKLGDLASVAGSVASTVTDNIKNPLGIFSPSKVMYGYGQNISEGLANGIRDKSFDVFQAVTGLGEGTRSAFNNYVTAILEDGDYLNDWLSHLPEEWRSAAESIGKYIESVMADGDYLNDWLTHLPEEHREALRAMGEAWQDELVVAAEAARAQVVSTYEGLLSDLEGLASGEVGTRLGQEFADLLNLQRIAEQAGQYDLAAHYGELAAAKSEELRMAGELMATPIVQGMTETLNADALVAEWDQKLAGAIAGPSFGENLQASIDELDTKIAFGKLEGAPQQVIDAWEAEKAELKKEAGFYWYDIAEAAAAGLIEPEALKEFAKAGGEQFEMYLDTLVGPKARKEMLGAVSAMGTETVEELKTIFAEAPEIANQFIDDIVEGMADGSIKVEDGMALLAMIPREELIPALEEMSDTYAEQIVQAIIDGNLELAASLQMTKDEVDALSESMDTGAKVAAVYNENMKQLPDGSWVNVGGSSKAGSGGSSGGGQVTPSTRGGMVGEDNGYSFNHNTGMWTGPDGTTWKSLGWEQAQQNQTIQNNVTVNVDGEPVAQSVNRVNTAALATNMGPV